MSTIYHQLKKIIFQGYTYKPRLQGLSFEYPVFDSHQLSQKILPNPNDLNGIRASEMIFIQHTHRHGPYLTFFYLTKGYQKRNSHAFITVSSFLHNCEEVVISISIFFFKPSFK